MRYYDITLRNHDTGKLIRPQPFQGLNLPSSYTSFVNGQTNRAALNIELQVFSYPFAVPLQGSWVRIWGVSIDEISQAANLNDCDITIRAGMQKGLPLAKPDQAGVIATGRVYRAVGNWEDADKRLDLFLYPADTKPLNFAFTWRKGTLLSDAIKSTLSTAMPGFQLKIAISDRLKMNGDMVAIYDRFEDFAYAVKQLTLLPQFKGIRTQGGGAYPGVEMTPSDKLIKVYDQTADVSANSISKPKVINFEDIIGQPTWVSPTQINFKCVMRADVSVGDYVKLPDGLNTPYVLTTQGAAIPGNAPSSNTLAFKGIFNVQKLGHFGNFRAPLASAWVTSIDAVFDSGAPSTAANNSSIISRAFSAPTGTTVT